MGLPFSAKSFAFTQPDGSKIDVIGWGNQYHAVFETPDGYTVVKNSDTTYYEIARISADGGNTAILHENSGRDTANLRKTYTAATTPALQNQAGEPISGNWTLSVIDQAGQDIGKLIHWRSKIRRE